ncbi:hypothetical protein IPN35_00575 [Candidatus Peregrinibacteria bacterium]|nr:MAG: hypothetical protein IPN35_00575 [Candidatus Peregrinibacteria bacterium]
MKKQAETSIRETAFSTFEFSCHYPEENPIGAEKDIAHVLSHVGVFDTLKKNQS